MYSRREGFRSYYNEAVRLIGHAFLARGEAIPTDVMHERSVDHAKRAVAAEDDLFGTDDLALEQLRQLNATLTAECRAYEMDSQVCERAFDELAEVAWGDGADRLRGYDVGNRAHWGQLKDRLLGEMVRAAKMVTDVKRGQAGAVATELAATQKQLAATAAEVLTMEGQLREHERLLDTLWENFHPGKEQDEDSPPAELAREIVEAWIAMCSTRLREEEARDADLTTSLEEVQDALVGLKRRMEDLASTLRGTESVEGSELAAALLRDFADILGPGTAEVAGCSCGAKFTSTAAAHEHECPLDVDAEIARGAAMGDALCARVAAGEKVF